MRKQQERLLIAVLAGLAIVGVAAALVAQPTLAGRGHGPRSLASQTVALSTNQFAMSHTG